MNVLAEEHGQSVTSDNIEILYILKKFENTQNMDIRKLPDVLETETKISNCMVDYISRQSKSYAKRVQNNLYDLMYNFDGVIDKMLGKRQKENPSLDDKLETLARMQCDLYYKMGILR